MLLLVCFVQFGTSCQCIFIWAILSRARGVTLGVGRVQCQELGLVVFAEPFWLDIFCDSVIFFRVHMVLCSHIIHSWQWIFEAVCLPAESGNGSVCKVTVCRNGISCFPWLLCKQRTTYASMWASSISRHIHVACFSAEEVESIQVADLLTWIFSEFVKRAKTCR